MPALGKKICIFLFWEAKMHLWLWQLKITKTLSASAKSHKGGAYCGLWS